MRPPCLNLLTKKAPYKGLGADSEEKHEPVSDIDTAPADSLKALDPKRPIREAEVILQRLAGAAMGLCRLMLSPKCNLPNEANSLPNGSARRCVRNYKGHLLMDGCSAATFSSNS